MKAANFFSANESAEDSATVSSSEVAGGVEDDVDVDEEAAAEDMRLEATAGDGGGG